MSRILESVRRDVRFAFRLRRRHPLQFATKVGSIALGMGANVAALALAYVIIFRPLPYPKPDRLVVIARARRALPTSEESRWSFAQARQILERSRAVFPIGVFGSRGVIIETGDGASHVIAEFANTAYFTSLGVRPRRGILFQSGAQWDAADLGASAILVSESLRRRLPAIDVGATLRINGVPVRVAGVLPEWFRGQRQRTDIWVPLELAPQITGSADMLGETVWWLEMVGRLVDGASVVDAADDLRQIALTRDWVIVPIRLQSVFVDPRLRRLTIALFGAACFVLLVACLNVMMLQLADLNRRESEFLVRHSVGASRHRLLVQLLTEHTMDALCAGLIAPVVAWAWLNEVTRRSPVLTNARFSDVDVQHWLRHPVIWVGGVATTIVLVLIVLFIGSALQLRTNHVWRREIPARSRDRGRLLEHAAIVVLQLTACVGCATAAWTFSRSLASVLHKSGWQGAEQVESARVEVSPAIDERRAHRYVTDLWRALRQRPGVINAGLDVVAPYAGDVQPTSVQLAVGEPPRPVELHAVTPGYLGLMGMRLRAGRDVAEQDQYDAPVVMVINEVAARTFWPDADPIGRVIPQVLLLGRTDKPWVPVEVVGVVSDAPFGRTIGGPKPAIYVPLAQDPQRHVYAFVRRARQAAAMDATLSSVASGVSRDIAWYDVATVGDRLRVATSRERLGAVVLGTFGFLATVLSLVGAFALARFLAVTRRKELAIRYAMGASPYALLVLVASRAAIVAVVGIGTGLAGAFAVDHVMRALVDGLVPLEPKALVEIGVALLGIVMAASFAPAFVGTRDGVAAALRSE